MSKGNIIIAPSILAADFANMEREAKRVEQGGGDWLHCDVMDGHFVPNITFGPQMVAALHRSTKLPLDVHLMLEWPDQYVEAFAEAGAYRLTINVEALGNTKPGTAGRAVFSKRVREGKRLNGKTHLSVAETLRLIKSLGCRAGLALNPLTPVRVAVPYLSEIDLLLVMTVWPGFGGQRFLPESVGRIREARVMLEERGRDIYIEVDGGIDNVTGEACAAAGANAFVAGTSLFGKPNLKRAIAELRACVSRQSNQT